MELRHPRQDLRWRRGDRPWRAWARHIQASHRGHNHGANARRLCLDRHAAVLPALVVRQAVRAQRGPLPQGLAGPRLRNRHQLEPVRGLSSRREHGHHADAGDGARGVRPQPLLQEQLRLQAVDGRGRHPRLPGLRQELYRGMRGPLWPGRGRARAGCGARTAKSRHTSLSRQEGHGPAFRGEA